ncbi:protein nagD [Shigella boydii 5216-82]|nr:protein nagD [Shigella boydii 5216-82]
MIVGETRSYNWDMMHKAAYFVANGARFIATNPDTHGRGFIPLVARCVQGLRKSPGANRSMLVSPARGSSAQH